MQKILKYGLILIKDGKLLVVRERNSQKYLLPGGRPQINETVEQALKREISEELGVKLQDDSLKYFGDFEDFAADQQNIVKIVAFFGKVSGDIKPCSEIEEIAWVGKDCNPELLSPILKNKILPALVRENYIK